MYKESSPHPSWLPAAILIAALGQPGRVAAQEGIDYLYPPADLAARAAAVQPIPGPAFGRGERVTYISFGNRTYELTRFRGRFVQILLPDSWLGPAALDESQVETLVDRSDLAYQVLTELIGKEPAGEGLLPVAVVPETCGWGCGYIGMKGVEIADIPRLNPILWRDVAADKGVGVLVHEMTHNFDVYSDYLGYLPDHPHAWTDIVNLYYFLYSREGTIEGPPDQAARQWLQTTAPYFEDPTATWERCVRDGLCEDRGILPNRAWGGLGYRLALFFGPQAARGAMAFLKDYSATHPAPSRAEDKEDLYVEALAAGAGRNLSCVVDAWHWHASPGLRRRMAARYSAPTVLCQDLDGDGWSRLRGDCDERSPAVRPGATETANGIDDDCDGLTDEVAVPEPSGGDFPFPRRLQLPALISGRISDENDSDRFFVWLDEPRQVQVELCSRPDFQGWLFAYENQQPLDGLYAGTGNCSRISYNLPAGRLRLEVVLNAASGPGTYTLTVASAAPWPVPTWLAAGTPEADRGSFRLTAFTARPPQGPPWPTEVRFWVSGLGVVGTVPFAPAMTFEWTPPSGFESAGALYRVQALSHGVPASDFSPWQPVDRP